MTYRRAPSDQPSGHPRRPAAWRGRIRAPSASRPAVRAAGAPGRAGARARAVSGCSDMALRVGLGVEAHVAEEALEHVAGELLRQRARVYLPLGSKATRTAAGASLWSRAPSRSAVAGMFSFGEWSLFEGTVFPDPVTIAGIHAGPRAQRRPGIEPARARQDRPRAEHVLEGVLGDARDRGCPGRR